MYNLREATSVDVTPTNPVTGTLYDFEAWDGKYGTNYSIYLETVDSGLVKVLTLKQRVDKQLSRPTMNTTIEALKQAGAEIRISKTPMPGDPTKSFLNIDYASTEARILAEALGKTNVGGNNPAPAANTNGTTPPATFAGGGARGRTFDDKLDSATGDYLKALEVAKEHVLPRWAVSQEPYSADAVVATLFIEANKR